jgi:hypothetical protein
LYIFYWNRIGWCWAKIFLWAVSRSSTKVVHTVNGKCAPGTLESHHYLLVTLYLCLWQLPSPWRNERWHLLKYLTIKEEWTTGKYFISNSVSLLLKSQRRRGFVFKVDISIHLRDDHRVEKKMLDFNLWEWADGYSFYEKPGV